jgi:hypothetical protein
MNQPSILEDYKEINDSELSLTVKVSKSTTCHKCGAYLGDLESVWYSFIRMDHNDKMIGAPVCDECLCKDDAGAKAPEIDSNGIII